MRRTTQRRVPISRRRHLDAREQDSYPIHNQWAGLIALFLVLSGGTAMAVDGSLPGQNTVGSADIINGEVTQNDLGPDSVGGGKIADRQVKNQDLSLGASSSNTIADGGVQGIDVKDDSLTGADVNEQELGAVPVAGDAFTLGGKNVLEVAPIRVHWTQTTAGGSPFIDLGSGLHYHVGCDPNFIQFTVEPSDPATVNVLSVAGGVDGTTGGISIPHGAQDVRALTSDSTGADRAFLTLSDTTGTATAGVQALIDTTFKTYVLDLHLHHIQGETPTCEVFGTANVASIT